MRIIVDKDVFRAGEYFGTLGEVVKIDGRKLTPALMRDADVLIVRSITRIDANLLRGSAVRFVGSVTSGIDHIDLDYLRDHAIGFGCAAGSNARAVAEYVLSSLLVLMEQRDIDIHDKTAMIIGCGHVGSLVREFLQTLGLYCLVNDPPLRDAGTGLHTSELKVIGEADIISLHVPLTKDGNYPTWHLIDAGLLDQLHPDSVLINTSRGGVVDETGALALLKRKPRAGMVMDVWQNEPDIDVELLKQVAVGTAHIAGYSLDAKWRAVEMVYQQLCTYLQQPAPAAGMNSLGRLPPVEITIAAGVTDADAIQMSVLTSYDVRTDSSALRQIIGMQPSQRAGYFDELRSQYRGRREFSSIRVTVPEGRPELVVKLQRLGFQTKLQT